MATANTMYQKIMSFVAEKNLQSELKIFLRQQCLSVMRGVHISDDKKINAMWLLLNAVALVDIDNGDAPESVLGPLLAEVKTYVTKDIENYDLYLGQSKKYIEKVIKNTAEKQILKAEYHGKPWVLFDKNLPSERKKAGLQKPDSDVPGSGLIPTENRKGWEFPKLESDIFTKKFSKYVSGPDKKRILILGAAYGTLAYDLLKTSQHNHSKFVINDLSPKHMEIFQDQLPVEYDNQVTVISGDLLKEADFPENHFHHILLRNVIHFFTPDEVDICLRRIYSWLKPDGSLTVTVSTPHWKILENYAPVFVDKKAAGDESPGFIPNLKAWLQQQNHPFADKAPEGPIHNFDPEILQKKLLKHHFQPGHSGFFAMPKTFPAIFHGDGEEYAGAIGYKPST